jgi:hypothetical protein
MSNKRLISDQVILRLAGGYPDVTFNVEERDVWKALEQKINGKFKVNQFSVNLPSGGTIPGNLCLATYENITVTRTSNERSKCTLPAMPISLPRNAGINEIRPVLSVVTSGDRILGNPLIPLQAGQAYLLQADRLLNSLLGQWGYEVNGKTTIFTEDLTTYGITKVDIKLVVFDISQYGITDVLPIPSDYEEELINELVVQFAPTPVETGQVNNPTNIGQLSQNGNSQ